MRDIAGINLELAAGDAEELVSFFAEIPEMQKLSKTLGPKIKKMAQAKDMDVKELIKDELSKEGFQKKLVNQLMPSLSAYIETFPDKAPSVIFKKYLELVPKEDMKDQFAAVLTSAMLQLAMAESMDFSD
jgi:hypothetical protein